MSQFDIYKNNNIDSASEFPYLLDIQSEILSSLETRVVVPLSINIKAIKYLNPEFEIDKKMYVLLTQELAGVHKSVLGEKCGSLQDNRSDIIAALDFMVSGF
ncbi:MAG: CcdB family protein [Sulfuricurvum sp.]|nr:CcdB family protein [Sulfuricurvum sp.]MDP3023542.1 CcdB family protein [Sulfuricurvum sp.]MDP3118877.1 CcdB family protein [Sulfuricurvum sp.]